MGILGERGMFPMKAFVQVDPDRLRRELPEMDGYVKRSSGTAGSLTHKEVSRSQGWGASSFPRRGRGRWRWRCRRSYWTRSEGVQHEGEEIEGRRAVL